MNVVLRLKFRAPGIARRNQRFLRFLFPEPKGGGVVIVKQSFVFSPQ
jgi:hypothetical protein